MIRIFDIIESKYSAASFEQRQRLRIFTFLVMLCPFLVVPLSVINTILGYRIEAYIDFTYIALNIVSFTLLCSGHYRLSSLLFILNAILLNLFTSLLTEFTYFNDIYMFACPAVFIQLMSFLIFYSRRNITITGIITLLSHLMISWYNLIHLQRFPLGPPVFRDIFVISFIITTTTIAGLMLHSIITRTIAKVIESEAGRRTLEEQLLHAQKMDAIGRLAGGIAHDFNNLLSVITGSTQLLQIKKHFDEDRISAISTAAASASTLTRKLLSLSRKSEVSFSPADINSVIREISPLIGPLMQDIQIEINLAVEPCISMIDKPQIEQVLINLAVNAQHAMGSKGVFTITTSHHEHIAEMPMLPLSLPAGHFVRIDISDTGHGMPPETLQRIFEPFFTTKPSGTGTGLGLSLAYAIIKQHNGLITVSSTPGKNTTFSIFLPYYREA